MCASCEFSSFSSSVCLRSPVFSVSVRSVVMLLCCCGNSCCVLSLFSKSLTWFYWLFVSVLRELVFICILHLFLAAFLLISFFSPFGFSCSIRWVLLSTPFWHLCYMVRVPLCLPLPALYVLAILYFYCLSLRNNLKFLLGYFHDLCVFWKYIDKEIFGDF